MDISCLIFCSLADPVLYPAVQTVDLFHHLTLLLYFCTAILSSLSDILTGTSNTAHNFPVTADNISADNFVKQKEINNI